MEILIGILAGVGFLLIMYVLGMILVKVWSRISPASKAGERQPTSPRVTATELRLRQEYDDYAARSEKRRTESKFRDQEWLEWALANPSDPVGSRHLRETLAGYRREHQLESHMAAHYQRTLEFNPQAQLDGMDYAALLAESGGKRDELASKILSIEMALGVDALSDQQ